MVFEAWWVEYILNSRGLVGWSHLEGQTDTALSSCREKCKCFISENMKGCTHSKNSTFLVSGTLLRRILQKGKKIFRIFAELDACTAIRFGDFEPSTS